jgi:hypothetical protein
MDINENPGVAADVQHGAALLVAVAIACSMTCAMIVLTVACSVPSSILTPLESLMQGSVREAATTESSANAAGRTLLSLRFHW